MTNLTVAFLDLGACNENKGLEEQSGANSNAKRIAVQRIGPGSFSATN
jgi:hypothetical protein